MPIYTLKVKIIGTVTDRFGADSYEEAVNVCKLLTADYLAKRENAAFEFSEEPPELVNVKPDS